MKQKDPLDPRGLIREAYSIDGIGPEDCRSIFFDWALGDKEGEDREAAAQLLDRYASDHPDHPMTAVLRAGVELSVAPRGRTGRRRRE